MTKPLKPHDARLMALSLCGKKCYRAFLLPWHHDGWVYYCDGRVIARVPHIAEHGSLPEYEKGAHLFDGRSFTPTDFVALSGYDHTSPHSRPR